MAGNVQCRKDVQLTFPMAETYVLDDVLRTVSFAIYPPCMGHSHTWNKRILQTSRWAKSEPAIGANDDACPSCAEARAKYRTHLLKKIRKAAIDRRLQLLDVYGRNNREPTNYGSLHMLAVSTSIRQEDLVDFCQNSERLLTNFEYGYAPSVGPDEPLLVKTQTGPDSSHPVTPLPATNDRETRPVRSIAEHNKSLHATYKELAAAFRVEANEDDNLEWFRQCCSNNLNRLNAFKDALVRPGQRGAGNMAIFDVAAIAAHLIEKRPKLSQAIRSALAKHFPEASDKYEAFEADVR